MHFAFCILRDTRISSSKAFVVWMVELPLLFLQFSTWPKIVEVITVKSGFLGHWQKTKQTRLHFLTNWSYYMYMVVVLAVFLLPRLHWVLCYFCLPQWIFDLLVPLLSLSTLIKYSLHIGLPWASHHWNSWLNWLGRFGFRFVSVSEITSSWKWGS